MKKGVTSGIVENLRQNDNTAFTLDDTRSLDDIWGASGRETSEGFYTCESCIKLYQLSNKSGQKIM